MNEGLSFKRDRRSRASIYSLRHTHATRLVAATGSLDLARRSLGHSSPALTLRYAKALPDELAAGVNEL